VKFGIGCRHFNDSMAIFSGRYGNLRCSIAKSGRSLVMKEYISFWMLSGGSTLRVLKKYVTGLQNKNFQL
jgi:hypothetical protein